MARGQRLAAQAAAASLRTPTPLVPEPSDDDMVDAPPAGTATPAEEDEDGDGMDQDGAGPDEQTEAPLTPMRDSDDPSRSTTPRQRGRSGSLLPRKRRIGARLSRNKQPGSDEERTEAPSDAGTPKRRGGFRGHRGGRWNKRGGGGPSQVSQVPVDKEGNMMDVVDDEVVTTPDSEGEKKVDGFGYLQDGREYRVRTFTILGRGRRLYMLSTEPARCIGFRDSYLFFQKHRLLYKIIIDDEEKRDLIQRSLIPHSYKGRAIGVVTARSVFREFGALIVIGGKKIVDEYDVSTARARGDVEGELAVPDDRLPLPGETYNRNQYVAWHGASAVYHSGAPSVPLPSGKAIDGKKRKVTMTSDNWMLEHAREASRFNSTLTAAREANNQEGHYDIHTNVIQCPKAMQPTHARWERVVSDRHPRSSNPISHQEQGEGRTAEDSTTTTTTTASSTSTAIFHPLPSIYSRNFLIQDVSLSSSPVPRSLGPDIHFFNATHDDPRDLFFPPKSNANMNSKYNDTINSELPTDCRQRLQEADQKESEWWSQWGGTEGRDGARRRFLASVEWFP